MSLGLALSGGGVRGAAHIGVLKAFEENGIKPKYLSGTSAGSIVATLYAVGYKPAEIEKIFLDFNSNLIDTDFLGLINFGMNLLFKKKSYIDGILRGNRIEKLINRLANLKNADKMYQIRIPLAIPAVDINTSEIVMFSSLSMENKDDIIYDNDAKISEAVRASISVPFIFKPKMLNGRRLVDGGVRDNVPIDVLKDMGASKIIAVNLGYCGENHEDIDNLIEISSQTLDIMAYQIFKDRENEVDYLLKPRIYNVNLLETSKIKYCIEKGYEYSKEIVPDLKKKLGI